MCTLSREVFIAIFVGAQGYPGRCNVPLTRGTCNDTEARIEEGTQNCLWHSLLFRAHRQVGGCREVSEEAATRSLPRGVVRGRGRGVDRRPSARKRCMKSFFERVEARRPTRASSNFTNIIECRLLSDRRQVRAQPHRRAPCERPRSSRVCEEAAGTARKGECALQRLRRWLGTYDQNRTLHRPGAGCALSAR